MTKYLLSPLLLIFLSCGLTSNNDAQGVYFSGEIVNPTSDYIVLYKNDVAVDSAALDDQNRFAFDIDNIEEGLHHFEHAPELQYVFIEKGDSITLRLNTVAFDESLVFSGTNGQVNNFLIEMFLNYEDEEQYVYSLYQLPPVAFSDKVDSLRNLKMQELNDLEEAVGLSVKAYGMAKAAIDYSSYTYKEIYPFYHKKYTGEETIHKLDAVFYDYRKELDVSHKDLVYFRPYYDFMVYHFGNLSYMSCSRNCGMKTHKPNDYLHLNRHKLELIDSTIAQEELRNNLLRSVAMDVLLKEHNINEDCRAFMNDFEELSTNKTHHEEIRNVYEGISNLQPNQRIPEVPLVSFNGEHTNLKEAVREGKSVVYFWSGSQKRHFRKVANQVQMLQQKHKDLNFIGICLLTSKEQWHEMLKESGLDHEKHYWSDNSNEVRKTLIVDGLNKCIITKDSLIKNGFAQLNSL